MVLVGFVLFALVVAAVIVLIAQNVDAVVQVHALGYNWQMHAYWVLVAGLVLAAVAVLGLAMMDSGVSRAWRIRRERRELRRENRRLTDLAYPKRGRSAATTAATPVAYSAPGTEPLSPATAEPVTTDQTRAPSYKPASGPRHRHVFGRTRQV